MLPVNKYVNTNNPLFKGKDDVELWELLSGEMRSLVVAEYIGDRIEQAIFDFGKQVGLVAMQLSKPSKEEKELALAPEGEDIPEAAMEEEVKKTLKPMKPSIRSPVMAMCAVCGKPLIVRKAVSVGSNAWRHEECEVTDNPTS